MLLRLTKPIYESDPPPLRPFPAFLFSWPQQHPMAHVLGGGSDINCKWDDWGERGDIFLHGDKNFFRFWRRGNVVCAYNFYPSFLCKLFVSFLHLRTLYDIVALLFLPNCILLMIQKTQNNYANNNITRVTEQVRLFVRLCTKTTLGKESLQDKSGY